MNDQVDRLYELIPVVYRRRDAEQGYPLKALLRVIAEQVNIVQDDITQLYENWFIETAQDWVVPYIGDLIGYRPVHEAGEPGDPRAAEGAARNKILIPRRDVANTIRYRRRKGTLALLEQLANDVAGLPARAVEFYRLLAWDQNVNHLHLNRARTVDVRDGNALDLINSPFESEAHNVDVRRVNSPRTRGRYNIPSVGVFVWRLRPYSVTKTPAYCLEHEVAANCYSFSVLSQDTPLHIKPTPETSPSHIARELNLPAVIRRYAFEKHVDDYYGPGKSIEIWADWAGHTLAHPIPSSAIVAADLTDWHYEPHRNFIAVDPVRGRMTFPASQLPKRVRVVYRYAFSADIGGGEYNRRVIQPRHCILYRVGEDQKFRRINDALAQWQADRQGAQSVEQKQRAAHGVIEITDSNVYVEQMLANLPAGASLQIRAANRKRPVIRMINFETDAPDSFAISMSAGSRLTLDGLVIAGRAVQIRAAQDDGRQRRKEQICSSEVVIRHCTLVPGWELDCDCNPLRSMEPSLELFNVSARVRIERSILGPIDVNLDETREDPIPISITDSIIDSTNAKKRAFSAPGQDAAYAQLTIRRCTIFGIVDVHAIQLAENSIFNDCLNVWRRQLGCMRFCFVPPGCRTPRRYQCQPDLAAQAAEDALHAAGLTDLAKIARAREQSQEAVRPQFTSTEYGTEAYCQLAETCPKEIRRGADDESEMGAFHDLFQPQRMANLNARLDEYMPADMQAGIILVN